jgi:hypothetical protein
VDVFSTCKLFYPLYSIADEDAIELDQSYTSKQFFSHFYGGPYSIRHSTSRKTCFSMSFSRSFLNNCSLADKDLSDILMDVLNISGDSGPTEQIIDGSPQQSPDQTISSGERDQYQQQTAQPEVESDCEAKKRASSI